MSMPGYGDEATWGRCYGHPNDPRTPDYEPSAYDEALDEGTRAINSTKSLIDSDALYELVEVLVKKYELDDREDYYLEVDLFSVLSQRRAHLEWIAKVSGQVAA